MTKPTASPHQQQGSSDGSAVEVGNVFRPAATELGVPFHRFKELKKSNLREATLCFADFKTGIIRRMEWEEATLFPAFDRKLGVLAGSISASLRAEHDQIREHLSAIELKLARQNPATESEEVALETVLGAHNHREHDAVYPVLEP
ncbi:MAG: hemerythrin domain-containing protein [Verrucomicrobia subdivision 3 bacterium]|nr:hemerythrin domain-containing protein [Limisphaerales bacterium]